MLLKILFFYLLNTLGVEFLLQCKMMPAETRCQLKHDSNCHRPRQEWVRKVTFLSQPFTPTSFRRGHHFLVQPTEFAVPLTSLLRWCICCWWLWGERCPRDIQGSAGLLAFPGRTLEGTQGLSQLQTRWVSHPSLVRPALLVPWGRSAHSCVLLHPRGSHCGSISTLPALQLPQRHAVSETGNTGAGAAHRALVLFVWAHKPSWRRQRPPQAWDSAGVREAMACF